jgi:hypothetical protein
LQRRNGFGCPFPDHGEVLALGFVHQDAQALARYADSQQLVDGFVSGAASTERRHDDSFPGHSGFSFCGNEPTLRLERW